MKFFKKNGLIALVCLVGIAVASFVNSCSAEHGTIGESITSGETTAQETSVPESETEKETEATETKHTQSETGTEETQEQPVGNDNMILYWIQWTGSSLVRPDGSRCLWDWEKAFFANVNRLSVHYLPQNEDGTYINGVADTDSIAELMELAKYDIQMSDNYGIKVVGYIDTCQVDEEVAKYMGYTLDELCAKKLDGSYYFTKAWSEKGAYIACINSPEWREWEKKILTLTAKAGFIGLQYDFHPYSAAGLFCQCENCKASWAEYSAEVLGKAQAMPANKLDFSTEYGREYFKWKVKCFTEFLDETVSGAREVNPDFSLIMNQNASGYSFAFEALTGAWNEAASEYHASNNGYDSTLYMYQLAEALGFKELYGQYGSTPEITPLFRYKVNLAESYAVIGGLSYAPDEGGLGNQMFEYLYNHQDIYSDNESAASAAVLYSAESNLFSIEKMNLDLGNQLMTFRNDRARQAAAGLIAESVCYDYLVVEKEDALIRLDKYDLLVLPSYTYFNDETWKPLLNAAAKAGKRIVAMGDAAKTYVESLGLPDSADIIYSPAFAVVDTQDELVVPEEFSLGVAGTAAANKVILLNNRTNTAATIRTSDENHTYIHVIRRGGDDRSESLYQSLQYTLPEGTDVKSVKVYCPFINLWNIDVEWKVTDGVLELKTGDFDTYVVICVQS